MITPAKMALAAFFTLAVIFATVIQPIWRLSCIVYLWLGMAINGDICFCAWRPRQVYIRWLALLFFVVRRQTNCNCQTDKPLYYYAMFQEALPDLALDRNGHRNCRATRNHSANCSTVNIVELENTVVYCLSSRRLKAAHRKSLAVTTIKAFWITDITLVCGSDSAALCVLLKVILSRLQQ